MRKENYLIVLIFLAAATTLFAVIASAATVAMPVQGGTGTSAKPTFGKLLVGTASGIYSLTSTSSLGLLTTNVAEGSNLYFTNGRAQSALSGLYEVPLTFSTGLTRSTNTITCNTANGSTFGCLTAANWTTFNGKQDALTLTTTGSSGAATLVGSTLNIPQYSSGGGASNVATSTGETAGQLAYWTSTNGTPALLGKVATGTVSGTGGITATAAQSVIGSGLTIGCTAADGSHTGCLSSTDWTTFNSKQAALTFSWPLVNSANTVSISGLATTTNLVSGHVVYASGAGSITDVATSSLGVSAPITFSGTLGAQVGGANGSFGCTAASSGVAGCLTTADWALLHTATTTFSSPLVYIPSTNAVNCPTCNTSSATVSSIATTWPITGGTITTTGTIAWNGLATTSQPASSNLLVSDGGRGVFGIATSTLTAGTGLTGSFTQIGSGGSVALSTPVSVANGGSGAATFTSGAVLYGNGAGAFGAVATSSFAVSAGFSYSGTLGNFVGGAAGTLSLKEHHSFTIATSTAWSGTTTIPLETGYGEVWNSVRCFTDAGTLNVDFYHSTSHLNFFNASTTNNTFALSTNNTITAADKTYVDIGTPASSPKVLNCTVADTL